MFGNTNLLSFQLINSQTGLTNSTVTDSFESAATRQLKISISTPLISIAEFVAECFQCSEFISGDFSGVAEKL